MIADTTPLGQSEKGSVLTIDNFASEERMKPLWDKLLAIGCPAWIRTRTEASKGPSATVTPPDKPRAQ
jgi:hypothetical protein